MFECMQGSSRCDSSRHVQQFEALMGKEDGHKPVDAQCKEKCMVTCPI